MERLIGTVRCDNCSFEKKRQNVFDWYNKNCPNCKNSIIINEDDISIARKMLELEDKKIISMSDKDIKNGDLVLNIDTRLLRN